MVNVTVIGGSALHTAGVPDDDPLSEFFRRFGIPLPNRERPRRLRTVQTMGELPIDSRRQ